MRLGLALICVATAPMTACLEAAPERTPTPSASATPAPSPMQAVWFTSEGYAPPAFNTHVVGAIEGLDGIASDRTYVVWLIDDVADQYLQVHVGPPQLGSLDFDFLHCFRTGKYKLGITFRGARSSENDPFLRWRRLFYSL